MKPIVDANTEVSSRNETKLRRESGDNSATDKTANAIPEKSEIFCRSGSPNDHLSSVVEETKAVAAAAAVEPQ